MSEAGLRDFLLENLVALAAHHGEPLERKGDVVQSLNGEAVLKFKSLEFGEQRPGNFVMLATVQISAPSTGMADLFDSILEGGPNTDIPIQHTLMEAYHLFQFVQNVLWGRALPEAEFALANVEGTRNFKVYSYGPILRADRDETRAVLEKKLANAWIFKKVFAEVPSALTGYRPYWVKVNHLKAGEANFPECRLDEVEWLGVQQQIATFQWPPVDGLMGYKQFFIFLPAGRQKSPV